MLPWSLTSLCKLWAFPRVIKVIVRIKSFMLLQEGQMLSVIKLIDCHLVRISGCGGGMLLCVCWKASSTVVVREQGHLPRVLVLWRMWQAIRQTNDLSVAEVWHNRQQLFMRLILVYWLSLWPQRFYSCVRNLLSQLFDFKFIKFDFLFFFFELYPKHRVFVVALTNLFVVALQLRLLGLKKVILSRIYFFTLLLELFYFLFSHCNLLFHRQRLLSFSRVS